MAARLSESLTLLYKIKTGDPHAADRLFRRYSDRLLKIVRLRLGHEMRRKVNSMDILQEALVAAVGEIGKFEPAHKGALLHWLSVKIENKIRDMYDYFRAAKRDLRAEVSLGRTVQTDSQSIEVYDLPGPDKTPSQNLMITEEMLRFEAALDTLGRDQREIVVLRLFEGLSFDEIGQMRGKQTDAVKKAYSRAMAKLTVALERSSDIAREA